ncbi:MAG: ABC transporter ATP-binding protein [Chloroflexi bacterium]|nr:ABC transporter ATP-binding protein [Chloroflexota bacterium]
MKLNGNPVVRTNNLTKHFGRIVAVNDLNLEVHQGQVFGFLGPNGSGKSTTMRMLMGLITPTSGSAEVLGLNIHDNLAVILPRVGAVMDTPGFYPYLSGWDNLKYFAQITIGVNKDRIKQVLDLVELSDRATDKFSSYSMGMKQRLAIACALLGDPEFIILDEPTNGLDPAGMKEIRELIIKLSKEGKTIFLNSHLLHEVEQVCDQVAIIKEGKLVTQGLVKDLMNHGNRLQLTVNEPEKAIIILKKFDWITSVTRENNTLSIDLKTEHIAEISPILAKENIFITEMKTTEETLERIFLELTEEK